MHPPPPTSVNDLEYSCLSEPSDTEDTNITKSYADKVLKEIRIKNINRIIIATLNINSLSTKFEQLKLIISNYLDILVIEETKLDHRFPDEQFFIDGYRNYRINRNCNGGGLII